MKNLLSAMLVLILTLGAISCSTESNELVPTTTKVVAIVSQAPTTQSDVQAKDVNRGSIYAWVSEVDMSFSHIISGYNVSENFTLVTSGGDANFTVDNVQLGVNDISATTNTGSDELLTTELIVNGKSQITTKLNQYKALNPYVLYQSDPLQQNIVTGTNVVNLNLKTQNGRRLSSIRWADNAIFKTAGYAKVSVISSGGVESTKYTIKDDDTVFNYWSNSDAVVGNSITIKAEIYSNADVLVTTYTRDITIQASTSITCSYIITDDELFEKVDGINLIFQEWKEINCTDC